MMKAYIKEFFKRGLMFSGFGPIILGIVYLILSLSIESFSLNGSQVFIAIISTYLLAFIQAGASVFNQIEKWPIAKSLFFHMGSIYLAYILCYLVNSWIPFNMRVIIIFTAVFVLTYFLIWLIVYSVVKSQTKQFNAKIANLK